MSKTALPPLRQDILISPATEARGAPFGWLLEDPLRHRHFRISDAAFRIMGLWECGEESALASQHLARYGTAPLHGEIAALRQFLAQNELLDSADWRAIADRCSRPRFWRSLLHNYLFFRVPLFNPSHFLKAAWPFVAFAFSRYFAIITTVAALAGLWLASRQWDAFAGSAARLSTPEGMALWGMCLVAIKTVHEFGHAFTAHKFGVRVPVMGAAFMMMAPVLYTDTTAAWKLPATRRLWIDAAGMLAEITLAAWATLAWAFLPDGPWRMIAFATATLSWVMSLAVNLNPLMRFDGYFLLSDALRIENLQERAFALARWRLREVLFGFGDTPPENAPLPAFMTAYGFTVWVYRLFLYAGIALVVYHATVKALGIGLLAFELVFLVAMPVWREIRHWLSRRGDMRLNGPALRSLILAVIALAALFAPIDRSVSLPAMIRPGRVHAIHAPGAAMITRFQLVEGQLVQAGDTLGTLAAPDLARQIGIAELESRRNAINLARTAADSAMRSNRIVNERQGAALGARTDAMAALQSRFTIVAPLGGIVANLEPDLSAGRWVNSGLRLLALIEAGTSDISGYAAEGAMMRLAVGVNGWFLPDDFSHPPLAVRLTRISPVSAAAIRLPALASVNGGPIAVDPESPTRLAPLDAWFELTFETATNKELPSRDLAGTVSLAATPESFARQALRRILGVLVRESGF